MKQGSAPCYVFDSSSLIYLERRANGKGLRDMPASPGKWLVVPSKVAKEVNSQGAPADTRHWLAGGKPAGFSTDEERRLFMKLRVQETLLDDADIQGIVIACCRKAVYVVDEIPARKVAELLGVRCITGLDFRRELQPGLF